MTFRQFRRWCVDRSCDGCWGYKEALFCAELIRDMMKVPWWKRGKTWKKIEFAVLYSVVAPTNKKRQEMAAMEG